MSVMFRVIVSSNSIEEFKVRKETNRTVSFIDEDGGEKTSMRSTNTQRWFHNKQEAKDFLVEKLEHRIKMNELAIKIAKISLEKLEGY